MTIVLAYIFYFVAASASPLQRRWLATREDKNHEGQVHFTFRITLVVALLSLLLPLFSPFYLHGNPSYLVLLAFLCGIFGAGFFICAFTAQRHVEAGLTTLISNIYTPVTIILASLFLNEKLTLVQICGTVLLLVGMLVVSKKHKIGRFKFDKYFVLMLVSGIALGIVLTVERELQKVTGFSAASMISWWSECLVLGAVAVLTKSKSYYTTKDTIITGGLRFMQNLSWVTLVFLVGNLSLVSAVTTFKVVVIFVLAAIFLGEREDLARKSFGSAVALAGLFLM